MSSERFFPIINDTYLENEQITPVDPARIDELERVVGGTLPLGYREYILRFGAKGQYTDGIRVWSPNIVMERSEEGRTIYDFETRLSYARDCPLTMDDFRQVFILAWTEEGDKILYFPRFAGEVFIMQRHAEEFLRIPEGFTDPLPLGFGGKRFDCFRYFRPEGKRSQHKTLTIDRAMSTRAVAELVAVYWTSGPTHVVQMPEHWGEHTVYVFVKQIGGLISVGSDPSFNQGRPSLGISFERIHAKQIKQFAQEFPRLVLEASL